MPNVNPELICFFCMGELSAPGAVCPHCGCDNRDRANGPGCLPGMVLDGQYFVGRSLGRGGFGITYLGCDLNLRRQVAIKEYFPAGLATRATDGVTLNPFSDSREAFERGQRRALEEGAIIAGMGRIPNVVQVYHTFRANGTVYTVMEYIPGATLSRIARSAPGGKLDWRYALDLLRPVMRALERVHAKGVIHRDVSPDNIILSRDTGEAMLLDFGAAHPYADAHGGHTQSLRPGFAPPEQYSSRHVQDGRTDEYALCATFYCLITGEIPTGADQLAFTGERLTPPRALGADIPAGVQAVLMKGLSIHMEDRYPSLALLERAFDTAAAEQPAAERPAAERQFPDIPTQASAPRRRRRPRIALLAVLAVAICALAVALGQGLRRGPDSAAPNAPAQAPATQVPATQAPSTQAPATQVPATQVPTQVPATQAPTQVPATQVPATQAPTQIPATQAPITARPTQVPATQAPSQAPATQVPIVPAPATEAPATAAPTAVPVTQAPPTEVPATPAPAIPRSEWPSMRKDWFDAPCEKTLIFSIRFSGSLADAPEDAWDVSAKGDGSALAWVVPHGGLYDLIIAGEGGVRAPKDCSYLFDGFVSAQSIRFDGRFDTSPATTMTYMFNGCSSMIELDLSGIDLTNVKDISYMFYGCISLAELDLSDFDTSGVTDMSVMFYECKSLTELDLSGFDTTHVTSMRAMFYGCASLTELDLTSFDTSRVTDMSGMFFNSTGLTRIDLSSFDTSRVQYMSDMFANCASLAELDLSGFDTSHVENMSQLFTDCASLTALDLSTFDTSRVTSMACMFYRCTGLAALDLTSFDTSRVRNMLAMFGDCSSLTALDLTSFDTSKVGNMKHMFANASQLTDLRVSDRFVIGAKTNTDGMFDNCPIQAIPTPTPVPTPEATPAPAWPTLRSDRAKSVGNEAGDTAFVFGSGYRRDTISSVTFANSLADAPDDAWDVSEAGDGSVLAWVTPIGARYDLTIAGEGGVRAPENCSRMFADYLYVTSIRFNGCFDTSAATTMDVMFGRCTALTILDLSGFSTASVTDMTEMFWGCESLPRLDLSGFDTANATNMYGLFFSCKSLTELDLSSFDTSRVTSMADMFQSCESLPELDLTSFDTSRVADMRAMFCYCKSLTGLHIGEGFTVGPNTNTFNMFLNCPIRSLPTPEVRRDALRQGDRGEDVRRLQQMLIDAGALDGKADGIFGAQTAQAVRAMQEALGMEPTGVADSAFLQALKDW